MSFLPSMREVKQLTFSSLPQVSNVTKPLQKNLEESQYRRKPQEDLAKETHGEKGLIVQEIRVQQISERPFPMTKMD